MYRYLLLFLLTIGFRFSVLAQKKDTVPSVLKVKDSITKKQDTAVARPFIPKPKKERVFIPDSTHSPHKAIMRSLIIPGWGQIYNHHWWKVPVIYTALGTLGYLLVMNTDSAKEFLALSQYREHGEDPTIKKLPYYQQYKLYINVPNQSIYDVYNYYLRDRDLSILGVLGAWGINLIDAYIDAKFINAYSVDSNLSMKVTPTLLNQPFYALTNNSSYIPGIKFTFTLK